MKPYHVLFFLITIHLRLYSASLPDFFIALYSENKNSINLSFQSLYSGICKDLNVDEANDQNISKINSLLFYHQLLTSTDAVDCNKGGILKTTYFWHWTVPNPRHQIRLMPDSVLLTDVHPIKGYEKYKSYADMDRYPNLYLADLITAYPKYYHPDCGSFFTFGWCSEREMAFNALLRCMNIRCKIKQVGIHVWSEVLVELINTKKEKGYYIVELDNTFNSVNCSRLKKDLIIWKNDFGTGKQVAWYNSVSKSPNQISAINHLEISDNVGIRIRNAVSNWLTSN